jgi:hypothetical protein
MNEYADLEISLQRYEADAYNVEFRYSQPDSDADVRLSQGQPALARFDFNALLSLAYDPLEYGKALTRSLFADPAVQSAFAEARASAGSLRSSLRLRLLIGASASELHRLHWETLLDPKDFSPLCTGENLLFSRYLSSQDWRPVSLRPKGDLRAVVAVANPSDLPKYELAPVDVKGELERARQGLGDISITPLGDASRRATLENIMTDLRDGFDILYLVCHGMNRSEPGGESETWLFLEDEEGKVARASGRELAIRFKELDVLPRLVVLASCQSAGASAVAATTPGAVAYKPSQTDSGALSALGPRLAEAGVPAVIAMQGDITMETVAQFMPTFFAEMQRDGQIDHAISVARGRVRARPDSWMPVLFMRLKSGRLWYVPGFGGEERDFEKWESLVTFILDKNCTPIIGPGLVEPLFGKWRDIALSWAIKHGYPLQARDQDDLPRVAQYIVTRHDPAFLIHALRDALRDEIMRRHAHHLPEELREAQRWSTEKLLQAIAQVADTYWADADRDPYKQLAQLRLPIYLTVNPGDLLARALEDAGVEPQVRICPWNNRIPASRWQFDDEPTPERPLVYYLYGHLSEPESIVLTEDEFFDYLIGVTANKELIPEGVRAAMSDSALLLLGFQMDDWKFRVLFRSFMRPEGGELSKYYSHVAAQIDPEDERIQDPMRARRYLEKYFETGKISIYWGSAEEFLFELRQQMKQTA